MKSLFEAINKRKDRLLSFACGILMGVLLLLGTKFRVGGKPLQAAGCLMWDAVILYLYLIRPASPLHKKPAYTDHKKKNRRTDIALFIVMAALIVATIAPMGAAPAYNGEYPEHRNQYELLARSLSQGHLYIDYDDVDPRLEELANVYDPNERWQAGVSFYRDHAYYKGRYYMYFGVVPAVLLFLPYYVITGNDLTTYHATQVFTAFAILGLFLLFRKLVKKYFPSMNVILFISLAAAFSFISTYFCIGTPALYCTATSSAVCMMVWSMFFFVSGVLLTDASDRKKQVIYACLGSLFGALSFGCRPTAALGNLVLIPLCIAFIRKRMGTDDKKKTAKTIADICIIAVPYVVIGILLMLYNYARFENPFEFGQAFQLTGADQSNYGSFLESFSTVRTVNGFLNNFIKFSPIRGEFPYVCYNSAFVNFPILLSVLGVFLKNVRKRAGEAGLKGFMCVLFAVPFVVTFVQIAWAPGDGSSERYRMDIYYAMVILAFLVLGYVIETAEEADRSKLSAFICLLCLAAVFMGMMFLLYPDDYNYTHWFPEGLENWKKFIMLH
ncbi:MAG: hypothetical protein J5696_04785 [Lachnospiraceae bacterium]|nr:hypothetical protein [Lachnospiraceae bacterium]